MSISGRHAPLSPVSVGGSEWSVSKYQGADEGPLPSGRANLASPPNSGGSSSAMSINGFPSAPKSTGGGPSPPASIARSSQGTNIYARSEGRNSVRAEVEEGVLSEHYLALRIFLHSRDQGPKQQPNKARDKLLRLSSVQFYELSTDVYDELMRRQAMAKIPPQAPNRPPPFLRPEKNFHPKRNQARQRLSSLGPPRFRDLAADVFHELERRFPRFVGSDMPRAGSPMSMRGGPGPISRTGTPVSGQFPPRGQSRMRRPSDAPSMRGPPPSDAYGLASPGMPPGDFGRPTPKPLNHNNTIVPNKSTMVEEDDDGDAFALEGAAKPDSKLIEDYENQVQELQKKLDDVQSEMKKKEEDMKSALDQERAQAAVTNIEKQEWGNLRIDLEKKLTEAQTLNDTMKQELQRVRDDHDSEIRQLREDMMIMQQNTREHADESLQSENDQLRQAVQEQQRITEQVRGEAAEFLTEMRQLSKQSGSTYDRQAELEQTVEQLEQEVGEWRNRYTRAKTQLRTMRGSTMGLPAEHDAAQYVREGGFSDDNGLIKDVHVTRFQVAVDDLLQRARAGDPTKIIDSMKSVVVSVRRITKTLDAAPSPDDETAHVRAKLRARVSSTANNLITASKNFAAGGGISPVSLVDAAASHLSAAIVELLKVVKIRVTSADELDEDDGTETPIDSSSFSPRSTVSHVTTTQGTHPPVPLPKGLGGIRASIDSSAYSPVNSPRQSTDPYARTQSTSKVNGTTNGAAYDHTNGANGYGDSEQARAEDLKLYLEDQNALLVSDIQNLVTTVRGDGDIDQITAELAAIAGTVGTIMSETQATGFGELVTSLSSCRSRLLEAGDRGQDMAKTGVDTASKDWRDWTQTLPPLAFETARETKELVRHLGQLASSDGYDDFA